MKPAENITLPKPFAKSEKRVALIIGNSSYRHVPTLTNPANDAADIAKSLELLGFTVVEGRDLDFSNTRSVIGEFSRKLASADVGLLYYAGHGLQAFGKNYLVPVDAKLDSISDLDFNAINLDSVLRVMEADERVNIVILDACRDNPFASSLRTSLGQARSTSVGRGLARVDVSGGTLVAFSTNPDNTASDGEPGERNSPFAQALLRQLANPDTEIESMMKRVSNDVRQATRGRQVPWRNSNLSRDVFLAGAARSMPLQ